jgi:hypothetical protein
MGFGHPTPLEVGRPAPMRDASLSARVRVGRDLHGHFSLVKRSVIPMRQMLGVLSPRKVTIRHNLVVHSGNSDDDLPLVRHDDRVDLKPDDVRIRYTQEPTLLAESPPHSPPPYIVSGWRMGEGYGKVFILNPDYKGKGHTESILSNPAPRMEWHRPPKIRGPPRTMEFSDDDTKDEKD